MSKKSFLDTKGLETLWSLFKNKLTNYDDKQAINDKLANYETKSELASTLSDYTLKADFDAKVKGHIIEKDVPADAQFTDTTYWEVGTGEHSVQTIGNNNNAIGEASVAEGAETDAHAYASHAEGYMTSTGISADYSHTEGYKTSSQGVASHAEGDSTVTNNPAEHAEGKYNKSNMGGTAATNTISSIGIGNASGSIPGGERKNAIEVMQNGDTYIVGIGSYDGKSIDTADTLQEVIEAKADKIDIPSNVSAFTNDAGYLTEHQSLAAYRTAAAQDAIHDSTKQDKLTKGYGILIDNNNKISIDDVDISTVEYVDANISDTMNFIIQERDNEYAGRVAGDNLLQEAIDTKQDIIEDLATIKSGAALGATAVQPEAIVNMATIDMLPTDLSDFIEPPTSDGNYSLECTVSNGIATYNWVLKS